MAIDLDQKDVVTLPAKEEVILDKLWIRQILIQTPSPLAEGQVRLDYGPWSGNMQDDAVWRNDKGEDMTKYITLNELYATLSQIPELNTAFNAILDAVKPIQKYLEDKAAVVVAEAAARVAAAAEVEAAAKAKIAAETAKIAEETAKIAEEAAKLAAEAIQKVDE